MTTIPHAQTTFRDYVLTTWLPNHVIEASTRQSYTYEINKHLIPWFGDSHLGEIHPYHVRQWVADCTSVGVSRANLRHLRQILSAIFTTAVTDGIIRQHPCTGIRTPSCPQRMLKVLTPEQFDLIYAALPDGWPRLLVATAIETGLRWGELTELRVGDFDGAHRELRVERAVVELSHSFHPAGQRFLVKPMPKSGWPRRVKISPKLTADLLAHIHHESLSANGLIFAYGPKKATAAAPTVDDLTAPNEQGRRYRHGTTSAYTAGNCRCPACRDAIAAYQRQRRGSVRRRPSIQPGEHISNGWFRRRFWLKAVAKSGIDVRVTFRDLRHAHASWLLAGGASIQVVKERLGHASITTTQRYLHTLPDADETAVEAFTLIRYRRTRGPDEPMAPASRPGQASAGRFAA